MRLKAVQVVVVAASERMGGPFISVTNGFCDTP